MLKCTNTKISYFGMVQSRFRMNLCCDKICRVIYKLTMNLVRMIGKFTMPFPLKPRFQGYLEMNPGLSFVCSGVCAHAPLIFQI